MQDPQWPPFLDLLDSNPQAAFAGFYKFAVEHLWNTPPRPMRQLNREDFQDILHDIVFHCVKDDFRVLRKYVAKGKPFASWLYAVAHNKSLDFLGSDKSNADCVSIEKESDGKSLAEILPGLHDGGEERFELRNLIATIRRLMASTDERCRMLLELAADEYKPSEMLTILQLRPDQNKKVSDDLRYCREKLKKRLREEGVDIDSVF
jgi:RNA polymerase sigma factor (sigma-70 family)